MLRRLSLLQVVSFCFMLRHDLSLGRDTRSYHNTSRHIHPYHLAGLILARGGSKGIPKKNLAILNEKPLIYWALKTMIQSHAFNTIWVSTDDDQISEWVEQEFPTEVQIHFRAAYTATDDASSLTAAQEFLAVHKEVDAIGLVQATSPFTQPIYLQQASILLSQCDSVFSVYRSRTLRWKAVSDPSTEFTSPLNFDPLNRPRRQDWVGEMVESGMFYFVKRRIIMKDNLLQGPNSMYIEVPEVHSLEIDTQRDLELADALMKEPKLITVHNSKLEL